jgi:RNA 2',3'-cyclic 3'-phosphodiesterase
MARDHAPGPQARSLRLFVAFDVSTEAAAAVERAIEPWTAVFPDARWVPRENWHVTLKFLGQAWPRLEGWVREWVGEAAEACGPVSSRLTGLGSFPSEGRGRVLWAGIEDPEGGLAHISATLDEGLRPEFPPESRPFSPHLTVARSEPPLRLPPTFVTTALEPVAFTVDRVVLFRSHLGRPVPRYEPLVTFPLAGA